MDKGTNVKKAAEGRTRQDKIAAPFYGRSLPASPRLPSWKGPDIISQSATLRDFAFPVREEIVVIFWL